MEEVFAGAVEAERFVTILLSVFGLLALFLAAVGVYGVISYAVSQRTHEIGLRMALGAPGSGVLIQVVREGLVLALIGVGVGLLGSVALSRGLETMVFGITATDPVTYVGVILVLTAAAAGASWIPARRASRVNPMVALRVEN
jgi:putative ABC transport system permease protein